MGIHTYTHTHTIHTFDFFVCVRILIVESKKKKDNNNILNMVKELFCINNQICYNHLYFFFWVLPKYSRWFFLVLLLYAFVKDLYQWGVNILKLSIIRFWVFIAIYKLWFYFFDNSDIGFYLVVKLGKSSIVNRVLLFECKKRYLYCKLYRSYCYF